MIIAEAILDFFPDTSLNDLTGVIERYRSVDTWPTTTEFSSESFYHLQDIMKAAKELDKTVKMTGEAGTYVSPREKEVIFDKCKGNPAFVEQAISYCFDCQIAD